ncbi:MAG TPA: VOC family protein [Candidatus Dormibacteraeota bacterium]|jgi:catechol 2,3-dioxygenase-like lactoylglutathione lyase family enzyme|nr:VOC family protein [Candidatus Dormibacteraeota bacterium]
MYDHIGLKVKNLDASVRFYTATLSTLGYMLCSRDDASAGFGPRDAPALWLYAGKSASRAGVHIAFRASERATVDAFHETGLKVGGRDNGLPGLRGDYSPNYYAAFLLDPDGNNIEAVCLT